ncbi:DUF1304 domain-containing protein [Bdellovibrio sp. 22V]|uniref:DUF1304 domain-containing protein n=1 Tax=Bdellovibrio TaxID=958 RepID=UPI002543B976|nr:DUF1304 domain-containing protein [Bdellovibrio sp. 22V]WII73390.1 DUF1304 domain-containing protein [Bdellovibrio sp. 22V]
MEYFTLKNGFVLIVALMHFYFLYLEMFLWTKPQGMKAFRMNAQQAQSTAVLAANQGLYNGFLAAGLLWSIFHPNPEFSYQVAVFFLTCVIVAAIYGGYSVGRKILYIQGLPATIALIVTILS